MRMLQKNEHTITESNNVALMLFYELLRSGVWLSAREIGHFTFVGSELEEFAPDNREFWFYNGSSSSRTSHFICQFGLVKDPDLGWILDEQGMAYRSVERVDSPTRPEGEVIRLPKTANADWAVLGDWTAADQSYYSSI